MFILNQTEKKIAAAKTKCGRLLKKLSDRELILDDESYIKLVHSGFYDNGRCYPYNVFTTQSMIKCTSKVKFEEKISFWIVMGPNDLKRRFNRLSGFALKEQRHFKG